MHNHLDAMNTGQAAVTWLSTAGSRSERSRRRCVRGWASGHRQEEVGVLPMDFSNPTPRLACGTADHPADPETVDVLRNRSAHSRPQGGQYNKPHTALATSV